VYINWSVIFNHRDFAHRMILELATKYPKCLNAITSVDIRDYWWENEIDDPTSEPHADMDDILASHLCGGALQLLPGPKTVYLTKSCPEEDRGNGNKWVLDPDPEWKQDVYGIKQAKRHIRKVLALNKRGYRMGKAPKVVIREWKCLPGVEMQDPGQVKGETSNEAFSDLGCGGEQQS
jgi:hypothetical protein